jgi:hypothetical protein
VRAVREAGLNDFEKRIVDAVEKYGWFGLSVAPRTESDDPAEWFTYTIGLPKSHGWPELICFGMDSGVAHAVLGNAIAECEAKNIPPAPGLELADVLIGSNVLLVDGSEIPEEYFLSAAWYARHAELGNPPRLLQLFWPDDAGRFPDDRECAPEVRELQMPWQTHQ